MGGTFTNGVHKGIIQPQNHIEWQLGLIVTTSIYVILVILNRSEY
jgi:hypothetical protein